MYLFLWLLLQVAQFWNSIFNYCSTVSFEAIDMRIDLQDSQALKKISLLTRKFVTRNEVI